MVASDVVSQGGDALSPSGENRTVECEMTNEETLKGLEDLCIARLQREHLDDAVASQLAGSMLEVCRSEALHTNRIETHKSRAVLAQRMLLRIEQVQKEVLVGHMPLWYPKTKSVFWSALCKGCFRIQDETFIVSLLKTKTVPGKAGQNPSESEALDTVLKEVLTTDIPSMKHHKWLLKPAVNFGCNPIVVNALAYNYFSKLPAEKRAWICSAD